MFIIHMVSIVAIGSRRQLDKLLAGRINFILSIILGLCYIYSCAHQIYIVYHKIYLLHMKADRQGSSYYGCQCHVLYHYSFSRFFLPLLEDVCLIRPCTIYTCILKISMKYISFSYVRQSQLCGSANILWTLVGKLFQVVPRISFFFFFFFPLSSSSSSFF